MSQSLMGCREKLVLGQDCPVETCHKEREHRGPCVVRFEVDGMEIEIRWRKLEPGKLRLS